MTEKRFTLHINWFNKEKTEGEALLKDNGQPLLLTESISDARLLKDILNGLNNENINIKNTIKEAYNNERTHIGRNVLKQLLNNIGETNE